MFIIGLPFTPGSRMRLKEYLRQDFVLARLEARDVEGVVREISVAADNPEGRAFLEELGYRPRRMLMTLVPGAGEQSTRDPQDELADL